MEYSLYKKQEVIEYLWLDKYDPYYISRYRNIANSTRSKDKYIRIITTTHTECCVRIKRLKG